MPLIRALLLPFSPSILSKEDRSTYNFGYPSEIKETILSSLIPTSA